MDYNDNDFYDEDDSSDFDDEDLDEENEFDFFDEEDSEGDEVEDESENISTSFNSSARVRPSFLDRDRDLFHSRESINITDFHQKPEITSLDINEIKNCGEFSPDERADEYRRRGQSPSGVIDGVYNDTYRGNGEYNDSYRDWEADA